MIQIHFKSIFKLENLLYNFYLFPSQVETQTDLKELTVNNPTECAFKCNIETSFTCRSFNLCDEGVSGNPLVTAKTYKCFLSENHNHNTDKDPNLQESYLCDHYSSNFCIQI